jgi:hypothetical protein
MGTGSGWLKNALANLTSVREGFDGTDLSVMSRICDDDADVGIIQKIGELFFDDLRNHLARDDGPAIFTGDRAHTVVFFVLACDQQGETHSMALCPNLFGSNSKIRSRSDAKYDLPVFVEQGTASLLCTNTRSIWLHWA